ncbi:MAG TPA: hypothetical protein VFL66_08810 [Gaiellaceae bacterium]|nr:hypothetical protein [Gaiellaceae bacterium]
MTNVSPRRVGALLAVLTLAACAGSASARGGDVSAPTNVHGFLLRADEPATTTFPRTPAFAWNPVQGAASYDFQLSTSSSFRDSGIVYQCPSAKCPELPTPVAAPGLSLPWITGSPHSLYARARAVMPDGTKSGWSASFGFDMVPAAAPTPQPAPPGVLRWSTVAGADAYEVWLIDLGVHEQVYTNVLDERELYTFHWAPSWIGSVRWRVRAVRSDAQSDERVNGMPISSYGPWSPIYQSTNPNPTAGQIKLGETVSDVIGTGQSTDRAHRLMPAFTWTGNQTLDGDSAELFRVYVFTDRQCLNPVFVGSVVGSPSYAPRPEGGLALPRSTGEVAAARTGYLRTLGTARASDKYATTFDDQQLEITENEAAQTPTTTLPLVGSSGQSSAFLQLSSSDIGSPVSLWDTDWPQGGYYWTVVPVQMVGAGTATLSADAPQGTTTVLFSGSASFKVGDKVRVGASAGAEVLTVAAVSGSAVTFTTATLAAHSAGDPISLVGAGGIVYQDMELPQDVCAAGRVARFGIDSEPSLVAGNDAFASGLSSSGRLTSAVKTDSFFKAPVVSWTPALGADAYEVQWSKSASPFVPVAGPGGAAGIMTGATSYVLPLDVGTWYYRVRGVDWSLPAGSQWMGWSDPTQIVVGGPQYKVIQSVKAKAKRHAARPAAKKRR